MDSYTKVTKQGYGSRIMGSIKGIFFGILLFLASFFVLWINEGSVDMSKVAKKSIEVDSSTIDKVNNEKLVSVTGEIISDEEVGDDLYLKPGKYIAVSRKVEMFSWVESTDTDTKTNLGGSETTTTTYNYNKQWSSSPPNSNNFEIKAGHFNPEMGLESSQNKVSKSNIGEYNINVGSIQVPYPSPVIPTINNTLLNNDNGSISIQKLYIFDGKGTIDNPKVGDLRISYNSLNNGESVTAMGKQDEKNLVSFSDKKGNKLFRIFSGTREDAISTLRTEYLFKLWIFRAIGFVLMWVGLSMLFGPISVLLDFFPIFGSISRGIVGIITFVVSFVLSLITILISLLFHNVYLLLAAVCVIGFFVAMYIKKKGEKNSKEIKNKEIKEIKRDDKPKKSKNDDDSSSGSMVDFDTE